MVTLLTLPLEIRLQIYDSVLTTVSTLRLKSQLVMASEIDTRDYKPSQLLTLPDFQQTALLQTCRQVHDEASPVFYQSNTFNFEPSGSDVLPHDDLDDVAGPGDVAGLDVMRNISVCVVWGDIINFPEMLKQYPSARALTVHFIGLYRNPFSRELDYIKFVEFSAPAMQERLDRFTLVALGDIGGMAELGKSFAIGYESRIQLLSEWPHISLGRRPISRYLTMMKHANLMLGLDDVRSGICMGTWRRKRVR